GEFAFLLEFFINRKIIPGRSILRGGDSRLRRVSKCRFDRGSPLVVIWFRNHSRNCVPRGLAQNSRRLPILIAVNLPAFRLLARQRHTRQLQCPCIGHCDVPIHSLQKYRVVRRDFVNIPACRDSLDRPQCFVPTTAHDPGIWLGFFHFCPDALAKFVEGLRSHQIHRQLFKSALCQVRVRIVKTGHYKFAAQLDHVRFRPLQLENLVVRPNSNDPISADRNCLFTLDAAERGAHRHSGVHIAVDIDGIRLRLRSSNLGPRQTRCAQHQCRNLHFHSPTPDSARSVSRIRFNPSSRPLQSNHSCSVWAPPPEPPPPIAIASRPRDKGTFASVDARCTCAAFPSCASTARIT